MWRIALFAVPWFVMTNPTVQFPAHTFFDTALGLLASRPEDEQQPTDED